MGRNFTDFLAGAGYFLLDTTREAVLRHDDETAQRGARSWDIDFNGGTL